MGAERTIRLSAALLARSPFRIWEQAQNSFRTPVESYLAWRGLTLPDGAGEAIRFHPACPFGVVRVPAMVALVRDVRTDKPKAIHRTAITVPGTLNRPTKTKLDRGRPAAPQLVKVATSWVGDLVEPERLKEAVADHAKPNGRTNGQDHAQGAPGDDWRLLWLILPEATKMLITAPAPHGVDRSPVAATVIHTLFRCEWSDEKIAAVIRAHPQGIGARYAEGKNLEADIARLRRKHEERESEQPDENKNASPHAGSGPHSERSLEEVHSVFERYLGKEYDMATLDAVLAATAAERLGGDPAWLLIISGPGNAKTETVQSIAAVPDTHIISTIASEGALLSASPRKSRSKDATGGLLRKIGDRGILVIKDVTSILGMDRNARGAVLAALREIHDGRWERNVGTDGGKTLSWEGRIVVIGACTTAWDQAHGVIASMGDRFVTIRSDSNTGRLAAGARAIRNVGIEGAMRKEMAEAVAGLIDHVDVDRDYALTDAENDHILRAADIVTKARTSVETDYRGDVIDAHAPEMPTRFAKQLSAIMRGGMAIGMSRDHALDLALRCAKDSVPQLRLDVLKDVKANGESLVTSIRVRLQKPRSTVDRTLQALHALGLLLCREETQQRGLKFVQVRHYQLEPSITAGLRHLLSPTRKCYGI